MVVHLKTNLQKSCLALFSPFVSLSLNKGKYDNEVLVLQERFAHLLTEMGQAVPTEEDFDTVDLVHGLL